MNSKLQFVLFQFYFIFINKTKIYGFVRNGTDPRSSYKNIGLTFINTFGMSRIFNSFKKK